MSDVKQTNFRISADDAEAFRQMCSGMSLSQAQGFAHIMKIVELDRAKKAIPGRAAEMEQFEMHAKAMIESFLYALEAYEDAQAVAADRMEIQEDEKDARIKELEEKLRLMKADADGFARENKLAAARIVRADKDNDELRERIRIMERLIEEKDEAYALLKKNVEESDLSAEKLKIVQQDLEQTNTSLEEATAIFDRLKTEYNNIKEEISLTESMASETVAKNARLEYELANVKEELSVTRDRLADREKEIEQVREEWRDRLAARERELTEKAAMLMAQNARLIGHLEQARIRTGIEDGK